MSTDHNRIKVADLEKNAQNKTLITNSKGELEFSDISNIKAESYNALDYTTEGKALDARQGKVLKDLIDSKQVDLATDTETQIVASISEDKKVVSRLKLFNWWQWVKSQAQTVSGIWNFTSKVTLASGNSTNPSLIMPNGTLTNIPQNGAIERDQNGALWNTVSGTRTELVPTRFSKNIGGFVNNVSYIFNKTGSIKNDIIELYNSAAGSSKIYPSNFNSRDNMAIGDVIDSELIMKNTGVPLSLILRFEIWRTTASGTSVLNNTFDYAWDTTSLNTISVRVIYTRVNSNMSSYGNLGRYTFLVNNMYQSVTDFYDYGNNDLRVKLVNNTTGTNNVNIYPVKSTNQFIPIA